jgi:hypothetical protein
MTHRRSYYAPDGFGKNLDDLDIDKDGRISFVEGALIGLQYFLKEAELKQMPCIKSKLFVKLSY